MFLMPRARTADSRVAARFPRLDELEPSPLEGDLAAELALRTAPLGPRGGAVKRAATPLSPTHSLFLRETAAGGAAGGAARRAGAHISTFHRLPCRPTRVVDSMQSRAYIGRFTPDGDLFVAAFQGERRIKLYDVSSGAWSVVKDVHARNLRWTVTDIALSSDSGYLLYASITPVVHLVNVRRGEGGTGVTRSVANITDVHEALDFSGGVGRANAIWSLRWSPDNREIAAGTGDASLYVYDVAAGRTVVRVRGHADDVNAVAYADDDSGNLILTGSDDAEIKAWDRRTLGAGGRGSPVAVFIGHTEGVAHLDAKGDGRYFISNGKDQAVRLWDLRSGRSPRAAAAARRDHGPGVPSFSWDYRWMRYPGEGRAVGHPADGSVAVYRGHSVLGTLCRAYWSPAATTGCRYIYAGSADGAVVMWDVVSGRQVGRLAYHRQSVRDCSWHPRLPLLATAAFDGSVVTWEPEVPGEAEAAEEERAAATATAGRGGGDVGGARKGRGGGLMPQPGVDQLGDWW